MNDTKSPFASKTVWASVITAGVGVAVAFGILPEGFDASEIVGAVTAILGLFTLYGRLTATTELVTPK